MSTGRLPQAIGHHLLPDGTDPAGRPVAGNVAIVAAVTITDPAHLPLGGPAVPGLWGEVVRVEDPGGRTISDTGDDESGELVLDPAEIDENPAGPGDLYHLAVQYSEPAQVAA